MSKMLSFFSKVVLTIALCGASVTSGWNAYQPSLPEQLMQ